MKHIFVFLSILSLTGCATATYREDAYSRCSSDFAEQFRRASSFDDLQRYEAMRDLTGHIDVENSRCLIELNHLLGEGVNLASEDLLVGTYLSVYFEHLESLSKEDFEIIRDKVISLGSLTKERLALVLTYMTFLKIDMRNHFGSIVDMNYEWNGVHYSQNSSFNYLLHLGVFGEDSSDGIVRGLRSIREVNGVQEYLWSLNDVKPRNYRKVLEFFLNDHRMTESDFLNSESLSSIAQTLLKS